MSVSQCISIFEDEKTRDRSPRIYIVWQVDWALVIPSCFVGLITHNAPSSVNPSITGQGSAVATILTKPRRLYSCKGDFGIRCL